MPSESNDDRKGVEIVDKILGRKKREPTTHAEAFSQASENLNLKPVEGEWLQIDRAELVKSEFGETSEYTIAGNDNSNYDNSRVEKVGGFDSNGGSIVYVDGEGRLWMAPFTKEAQANLIKAGYEPKGMGVPHMFDMITRFKDEEMHRKWVDMSNKAGIKAHDFELKDTETKE